MVMRTDCQSHQKLRVWGQLILLAGYICAWGPSAQASFILQAKGLQAQARPGTLLHGRIILLNALFDEQQEVALKIVEFIPITAQEWQPMDPNQSMDSNSPQNTSKTQSCRKWIRLGQTEITVEPVDRVVVPVDIRIPKDLTGLYRAAIVVNVPPPSTHFGVVTGYNLVLPVLLEVKVPPKGIPLESEDCTLEIHPKPIKVAQDTYAPNPYQTYTGSKRTFLETTIPARLKVTAEAISPAGGIWRAAIDPNEIHSTGEIEIRVSGKDVHIDKLTGGSKNVTVALVTVQMIPDLSNWPYFWRE